MTTVSVSESYQLSAAHSSVVIMSCSKDVLKIKERNVSLKAQHLGKLFTFICAIYTFYQAVAWSVFKFVTGHSHFLVLTQAQYVGFLEQHTYNTEENLTFQTFFLDLI